MQAKRVLLVDDDEDYTHFVRKLLAGTGKRFVVDMVHDEAGAIRALDENPYDLIVSDYELSPGCGTRVLAHARKRRPAARRVFLTSAPDRPRAEPDDGEQPEPDAVWDKRWELATIRNRLRKLLEESA